MYAQPGVLLGLLALAGEALSHSLGGEGARGNAASHARSARSHRRRGLPGADGAENPCKRASSGLKITDAGAASSNVTVIPATNYLHQGFGANKDQQSENNDGSQQDSASGSSQFTDRSSGTRQPLSNARLTSSHVFSSNDRVGLAPSPSSSSDDASSSSSSQASTSGSPSSSSGKGMSTVASWSGNDFLSWDYFTYSDPTHGNVNYVSLSDAQSQNLVSLQDGRFKMAVSTGSVVNNNRNSVRISSPTNWKKGQLLVADINHIPEGCGTWPALWSIGAKRAWPAGGEIDIMEGVNDAAGNTYTLHTTAGCSMSGQSQSSGFGLTEDCQYQPGCSYKDKQDNSYGPDFNAAGGGFYASFFDDAGIKIWFWTANEAPSSIKDGAPDMSEFGTPKAFFSGSTCNMDSFFDEEQMIIINTTLMGDWAGATFWNNGCSGTLAATIADASNFDKAYWLINSVKIYSS